MMIETSSSHQSIKNDNYFDDLQVIAAFQKTFSDDLPGMTHLCKGKYYSLEMIHSGRVRLRLDQEIITLEGPCVFWIGDSHRTFEYIAFPHTTYEHFWVDFKGERGTRIYNALKKSFSNDYAKVHDPVPIAKLFREIASRFRVPRRPGPSAENTLLIERLVYEILRCAEEDNALFHPGTDPLIKLKTLTEKIKSSPFEGYDPTALADQFGFSEVHFRSIFRNYTSLPIHRFILEQQMLTAGELLKNGQFRIGELADYCNFRDTASFTRSFKRYYNVSPRKWLDLHGRDRQVQDDDTH